MDKAGTFHQIPRLDGSRLAGIFAQKVMAFLVGWELLSPEWAERLFSWRDTGFNVHSQYIHRPHEADIRGGEASTFPYLRADRARSCRRERGILLSAAAFYGY